MIRFKSITRLESGEVIAYYDTYIPMPGESMGYQGQVLIKCNDMADDPRERYEVSTGFSEIHGATAADAMGRLAKWLRATADELEKKRTAEPLYLPLLNER